MRYGSAAAALIIFLAILAPVRAQETATLSGGYGEGREALEQARLLFYASVEEKKQIEPAIAAFKALAGDFPEWAGRAKTYVGALVALQGKHAFMPHDKWRLANRGLEIMDEGVAMAPEDVESLFIHSSTCYYLPFFFKRGKDAQAKFRELVRLLPEKHHEFDAPMLANVVQFIAERARLNESEKVALERIRVERSLQAAGPGRVEEQEEAGS